MRILNIEYIVTIGYFSFVTTLLPQVEPGNSTENKKEKPQRIEPN
jgi:hypothetical protein